MKKKPKKILVQIPSLYPPISVGIEALQKADDLKDKGEEITVNINPSLHPEEVIASNNLRCLTVKDFIVGGPVDHSDFDKVIHENDLADENFDIDDYEVEEIEAEAEEEIEGEAEEDVEEEVEAEIEAEAEENEEVTEEEGESEVETSEAEESVEPEGFFCDGCGAGPFETEAGLRVHKSRYCKKRKKKKKGG